MSAACEEFESRPVEEMDKYHVAAEYAITYALHNGTGHLLRAIKTLMEATVENPRPRE